MGAVRVINDDGQFYSEMASAGTKLVVVDFTATWCGPCQRIAPVFEQLSGKYPNAIFLKVDVDKCEETAAAQGVSAMPTFIFYRNHTKLGLCQGDDPVGLESKIQQFYGVGDSEESESPVSGHMDLSTFITKSQCECLNESDEHNFVQCLTSDDGYLESDCDEQLILSIAFSQTVKIHSLKIKAPKDKGPKNIKLYINQPRTIDFDMADSNTSIQQLTLSSKDLEEGNVIPLRFVKFQNVQNLQIFVKDNQNGSETTRIDHLIIIGSPISTTNMDDFKRVIGRIGESH
ncbi:PREDICTED: thioredoxin-like protein 1 [Dufourea novaeangliae]|uniref:Thioredoxin-like protein 1 n=1 Tax=Dufourea novaeangliae TaxID=178035 RepID=A0A154P116_DUFNO|nr:PREDICTED: thioredoxin-like protein 1 [Dufourea novaeangliae]KZC05551.1 Thioredoxin-like protein 1 [Dufourea novaeangliae]